MKDYYDILEVTSKDSKEDIKRAYFKLVRKYPPDRFEAEFMRIREAYETLSNEETRKQYDSINNLGSIMKEEYSLARTYLEEGDLNKAIKILEKMAKADSNMLIVKALLGEAYLKNNNSGKALKVYEELTSVEPKNAAFAGYLANAYLNRGWQKKAIIAYDRAIGLDSDNISLWLGLSGAHVINNEYHDARNVLEKALGIVKDIDTSTTIYIKLIMIDINFGMFFLIHKSLDKLAELAINNDEVKDNVAWTLSHIADYLMQMGREEDARKLIEKAAEILPKDKEILKTEKEIVNYTSYTDEFQKLEKNKKIKHEVAAIIAFEVLTNNMLGMYDEEEKEAMAYFQKSMVLDYYDNYKTSIKKLEKDYPKLYALESEFFNKLTSNIERKKMQDEYKKQLPKYGPILEKFFDEEDEDEEYDEDGRGDYEPQEPIVREEPKIGRNDPCPCGSGKKYKKCCGK
ncbi:tetratricopeptide repeat protein [Clostridium sp.]|uniref:tetratricopeptide repeat protein n=1 Tax=Clostridium sp. TaxID=1506 RepID=UPI00261E8C19|nr:tetratricopeptide repeat protein [uncultured Clostridium sp.]